MVEVAWRILITDIMLVTFTEEHITKTEIIFKNIQNNN